MSSLSHWFFSGLQNWWVGGLLSISILLTLVAAGSAGVARKRPTWRHTLWLSCLLAIVAFPVLSAALNSVGVRASVLQIQSSWLSRVEPPPSNNAKGSILSPLSLQGDAKTQASSPHSVPQAPRRTLARAPFEGGIPEDESFQNSDLRPSFMPFIWLIWAGGICYLLARLGVGWIQTNRLVRTSSPLDIKSRRGVYDRVSRVIRSDLWPSLAVSRFLSLPCVVGLFRPRVILPDQMVQTSDDDTLVQVLIHELAHVRRGDPWVLRLQRFVAVPLWFHPLVHWMNHELDRAREEICDNYVLRDSRPVDYAGTLLGLAQVRPARTEFEATLSILQREHSLVFRIKCLLDRTRDRSTELATRERLAVGLLIAILSVSTCMVRVQGTAQEVARVPANSGLPAYEFIDLDAQFRPQAMNERRQVVGTLLSSDSSESWGAVWSADHGLERLQLISEEADARSALCAINDRGSVAGYIIEREHSWRPFSGLPTQGLPRIPDLGGDQAPPSAINSAGQVVGWSDTPGHGGWKAFLFTPGEGTKSLGTLGGRTSQASAINDKGWVVGYSEIQDDWDSGLPKSQPFLWRPNQGMVSLGALEGFSDYGRASDINDNGQIVGSTARMVRRELTEEQAEARRERAEAALRFRDSKAKVVSGPVSLAIPLMRPFRWSEGTGMTALPYPSDFDGASAVAINNRNTVLLEAYNLPAEGTDPLLLQRDLAFFLVTSSGIQRLPDREGFQATRYLSIKDDGSLVGYASNPIPDESAQVREEIQGFVAVPRR